MHFLEHSEELPIKTIEGILPVNPTSSGKVLNTHTDIYIYIYIFTLLHWQIFYFGYMFIYKTKQYNIM